MNSSFSNKKHSNKRSAKKQQHAYDHHTHCTIFLRHTTIVFNQVSRGQMKYLTLISSFGIAVVLSACSSNPAATLALQNENHQFEVTGLGKTAVIAKNNAILAANKTCSRQTPIIRNESTNYNGILKNVTDEQTGQSITTATEVIGGILGYSPKLQRDDDYQTTLIFTCQNK